MEGVDRVSTVYYAPINVLPPPPANMGFFLQYEVKMSGLIPLGGRRGAVYLYIYITSYRRDFFAFFFGWTIHHQSLV